MTTPTITTVVEQQLAQIRKLAASLDERGYVVLAHGLNNLGKNSRLFGPYVAVTQRFLPIAAEAVKRKAHIIHVWFSNQHTRDVNNGVCAASFDHIALFEFQLPLTRAFAEVRAMLSMCAVEMVGGRYAVRCAAKGAQAPLICRRPKTKNKPTYEEFSGKSRGALEILVRHLEMPEARAALKGETRG